MIAEFHTQDPRFGYNIANGGSNRIPTEETRKKMSDVRKGEKNHWARAVLCDGMRFGHIGACADYYKVGRSLMNSWLVGKNLLTSNFVDMMELSDKVSIAELEVKKEWLGKNLAELHLRSEYSLNVVAIKKDDSEIENYNKARQSEERRNYSSKRICYKKLGVSD